MSSAGWLLVSAGSFSVMGLALASDPVKRWYRKVKRRRGGIYLWRVDHHLHRARRVNGYVGETVSYYFRAKQHMGSTHFKVDGTRSMSERRAQSQPWSDLNPTMHKILPLPWWLCWKWVLRPLETLAIILLWPRYNQAKNRWNPRRIPSHQARLDRFHRDQGSLGYRARVGVAHLGRGLLQVAGLLVVLGAAFLWVVSR